MEATYSPEVFTTRTEYTGGTHTALPNTEGFERSFIFWDTLIYQICKQMWTLDTPIDWRWFLSESSNWLLDLLHRVFISNFLTLKD